MSLQPVIRGGRFGAPRDLFVLFGAGSIIRGNDKLIAFWQEGRRELYALAADPGETRDPASSRPVLARALGDTLDRWFADSLPRP
jgi:hypothetical protein